MDTNTPQEGNELSFLGHLEILRWTIVRSFLSVMFFAIIAFIFHRIIFDVIILAPRSPDFWTNVQLCKLGHWVGIDSLCINSHPFEIINISMAGQFSTHISVSLVLGIILAFPYIFWEFWRFIKPGLYDSEARHTRGAVFYSSTLFLAGVLFGYYLIVPLSVHFLGSYNVSEQVNNQINLSSYISTFTSVVIAAGVIFELPVFILVLSKAGLVTADMLRTYRKHAIVVILLLSAIITPPDIFSQILVCLPLLVLYEAGIIISKRVEKKLYPTE